MYRNEWYDLIDYEGIYKINKNGDILSINYNHTKQSKILSPRKNRDGYMIVTLTKNKTKKTAQVHRLVAKNFIENPNNFEQVNHKDENKTNNYVSNLEWCNAKYNNNYGTRLQRQGNSCKGKLLNRKDMSLQIDQFDKNGNLINTYTSIQECARINSINPSNICSCIKGRLKTCGGYVWKYHISSEVELC